MGALTSNRKRCKDLFYSNCRTPVSNFSIFDHHIPKKLKLSASINQTLNPPLHSKSTVGRFFEYPNPINATRREVHAPCRQSRFGSKPSLYHTTSYIVNYKVNSEYSATEMGISLSRKYDETKRTDFDCLRCLKKDTEVIDIDDDDTAKERDIEDSSIEEVESRGCEKSDLLGQKSMEVDGYEEILDGYDGKDSSMVTAGLDDGNLKEGSVGKMIDSLALKPTSNSYLRVPWYKKFLGLVGKINDNLKILRFQIGYNEKCLETNMLLQHQKKSEQVKEDVIAQSFVPLTEEEKAEVSHALSKSNQYDLRRVLATHKNSNIDITGEILQCLSPGELLNDEVINVYLELLKEREKREPHKFLKCHFFNTFFYKKLISGRGGYNYQSVRRWTSQRKLGYCLLECDKIFVPIHKEIHWCLAVINKKDEKFQYLDPLKGRDSNVLKVLARYFVDEVKNKSGKHIDFSSWKQEFVEDLPEQKNGYDCGVFMIKNVDFYSRDIGLCFNQGDMPYFRLRTAKELLRLKAD